MTSASSNGTVEWLVALSVYTWTCAAIYKRIVCHAGMRSPGAEP